MSGAESPGHAPAVPLDVPQDAQADYSLKCSPVPRYRRFFLPGALVPSVYNHHESFPSRAGRAIALAKVAAVLVLVLLYISSCSLTVSGFQALLPVLLKEGKFAVLCEGEEPYPPTVYACLAQEEAMGRMFIMAGAACNLCLLPGGFLHDRLGPRLYAMIGSALLTAGGLGLAGSNATGILFASYAMMAVGNTIIFFSLVHFANILPTARAALLTLFRMVEPMSALVFVCISAAYNNLGHPSLLLLFGVYGTLLPGTFVLFAYLFQPGRPFVIQFQHESVGATPDATGVPECSKEYADMHVMCEMKPRQGAEGQGEEYAHRGDVELDGGAQLLDRDAWVRSKNGAGGDGGGGLSRKGGQESFQSSRMKFKQQLVTPELWSTTAFCMVAVSFTWFFEATVTDSVPSYEQQQAETAYMISFITCGFLALPYGIIVDQGGVWAGALILGGMFATLGIMTATPAYRTIEFRMYAVYPLYVTTRTCQFALWTHIGNVAGGRNIGLFIGCSALGAALGQLTVGLAMLDYADAHDAYTEVTTGCLVVVTAACLGLASVFYFRKIEHAAPLTARGSLMQDRY